MLLGIGTTVLGELMEGISVSTLADLDEFIEMGLKAENLTGETVLPATPAEIRSKAAALRAAQPDWIWEAVEELENEIRTGKVVVPLALSAEVVDYWRTVFGPTPTAEAVPLSVYAIIIVIIVIALAAIAIVRRKS